MRVRVRSHLLVGLVAVAASTSLLAPGAGAQSDADLGCSYSLAPLTAGPVEYSNPLRLDIEGCSYAWDIFHVSLGAGAFIVEMTASTEFECSDGDRVLCFRGERHPDGAAATMRPQCPQGEPVVATLGVSGSDPIRTGAPRTFPCVAPRMRTVAPPATQSMRSARRRGVVARFFCGKACTARLSVEVWPSPSAGYSVGSRTFRRKRGTHTVRIPLDRKTRGAWRTRRKADVTVNGTLRLRSGETVSGDHDVRLRR